MDWNEFNEIYEFIFAEKTEAKKTQINRVYMNFVHQ